MQQVTNSNIQLQIGQQHILPIHQV